jgi:hypothetical protein
MVKRYKKNDLTAWFLQDHATLPASYVKSCEKFFKEISSKPQATSNKRQATSRLTNNLNYGIK